MKLYNSLSKAKDDFQPQNPDLISLYVCGPTVYSSLHIGNLRSALLGDLLKRTLEFNNFKVKFVMNITDVGHLTSDGDSGEDKMEKHAKTPEDVFSVASQVTDEYLRDLKALNIERATLMPKASEHVKEQIEMIKALVEKGCAYESDEAVYFDVSKALDYNRLTGQNLSDMLVGARQDVVEDPKKKNPIDFVLWFKTVGRYQNHILRWESPWGEGFPGWHIECSAMSIKYLGETIDIHAGGIDLKFPHHTNEIAQSESATGKPFVKYWVHGEHLLVDKSKMSKSLGNVLALQDLQAKNFNPLAFRYLLLTSHYRSKLNFTWDSLASSQTALNNLYQDITSYPDGGNLLSSYFEQFKSAIDDDLNTAKGLVVVWDLIKSEEKPEDKLETLLKFDQILGLGIKEAWNSARIPDSVQEMVNEREEARQNKDFAKSDELRQKIETQGFILDDTIDGYRLKKRF